MILVNDILYNLCIASSFILSFLYFKGTFKVYIFHKHRRTVL